MPTQKVSRKELLKSTDEFISITSRLLLYVQSHSKLFSNIGLGILAAILIGLGAYTYILYANKKGQEVYNEAYIAFLEYERATPEKKAEALQKAEELLRKVLTEQKIAKVNTLAYPELAYLKFQEKKYDEALNLYQEYQKKIAVDSPYHNLAGLAIAACYEEKGDFSNAVAILEKTLNNPKETFKEQVMLNLARNYRLTNQKDKAKETLKKFIEKYPDSSNKPLVQMQLSQMP